MNEFVFQINGSVCGGGIVDGLLNLTFTGVILFTESDDEQSVSLIDGGGGGGGVRKLLVAGKCLIKALFLVILTNGLVKYSFKAKSNLANEVKGLAASRKGIV